MTVTDPVYFKNYLRVTIQAPAWISDGRYCPSQDDIPSVAYRYYDNLNDVYLDMPDKNDLELI